MSRASFRGFTPKQIPQVSSGYFWDPAQASGSGTTSFLLIEGNKKTSYNMTTPSLAAAPTIGLVNNHPVITYTSGAVDDLARTSEMVQRGWTGATMAWGWISFSSGPGVFFGHARTPNNLRINVGASRTDIFAHDGTVDQEYRFPVATSPVYIEVLFVPTAAATNRVQLFYNRVQQTPTLAPSFGSTSLTDASAYLTYCGSVSDSSTFNIGADVSCGVGGICNGIPSDKDRNRLFNYRRFS